MKRNERRTERRVATGTLAMKVPALSMAIRPLYNRTTGLKCFYLELFRLPIVHFLAGLGTFEYLIR